jgi:hypothetical protein
MIDRTPQWLAVLRDAQEARGEAAVPLAVFANSSAWREPPSPFMQQAAGLNKSLSDLSTFLSSQFYDYVDVARAVPSKVLQLQSKLAICSQRES